MNKPLDSFNPDTDIHPASALAVGWRVYHAAFESWGGWMLVESTQRIQANMPFTDAWYVRFTSHTPDGRKWVGMQREDLLMIVRPPQAAVSAASAPQ